MSSKSTDSACAVVHLDLYLDILYIYKPYVGLERRRRAIR